VKHGVFVTENTETLVTPRFVYALFAEGGGFGSRLYCAARRRQISGKNGAHYGVPQMRNVRRILSSGRQIKKSERKFRSLS
jgi:hypothetical protein